MTSYRVAFDRYEVITSCNIHLGDNNVVEAINMTSIVVETNGYSAP